MMGRVNRTFRRTGTDSRPVQAKRSGVSVVAVAFCALLLSACGGGGGSSSPGTSPSSPGTQPSQLAASTSSAWQSPTAYIAAGALVVFSNTPHTGSGEFVLNIYDPSIINASIPVPPSIPDTINMSFYRGGTAPYPAASGSIIGYLQFSVAPTTITPPAGQSYSVGTDYKVELLDPLNITPGSFVYCALYAGPTLVGSGSNAFINNPDNTGPGFACDAADHGNTNSPAPGFPLQTLQAGVTYTIVYSVGT